jgi:hypothetical protein
VVTVVTTTTTATASGTRRHRNRDECPSNLLGNAFPAHPLSVAGGAVSAFRSLVLPELRGSFGVIAAAPKPVFGSALTRTGAITSLHGRRERGIAMNVKGSCLCGGIKYEIEGQFGRVVNCHCSMCRKATGGAFRTRAAVPAAAFRFVTGEALLSKYESSPGETRTFCRVCGSTLPTFFRDRPEWIGLPLGTLDDDPGVTPTAHVWVGSKAPWWTITDDLPQYDESVT